MKELRFALIGAGFWGPYHMAGYQEAGGAKCVAVYNRTRSKAEALAKRFGIPTVYDDPRTMLEREKVDFVDCITDGDTHSQFVHLAAEFGRPVICQKPLAPSLEEAQKMVAACHSKGVPLLVHENFRWQTPLRQLKALLDSGELGNIFRARLMYVTSFPVYDNQPFLKKVDKFVLVDIGTHVLDVARFLFGEAKTLYCRTCQARRDILGEDVATVMLGMASGATVLCDLSYASRTEYERFPQTYAFIEGEKGSAELCFDYWIKVTTENGTLARRFPPPRYTWADPVYDVAHASIVPCHANLLAALRGERPAETTGEDNLKTLELVYGSYESAQVDATLRLSGDVAHP